MGVFVLGPRLADLLRFLCRCCCLQLMREDLLQTPVSFCLRRFCVRLTSHLPRPLRNSREFRWLAAEFEHLGPVSQLFVTGCEPKTKSFVSFFPFSFSSSLF